MIKKILLLILCFLVVSPARAGLFDDFDMTDTDVIKYVQKVGYNHAFDDIMNNSGLDKPILKISSINRRYDIVMNYLVNNYSEEKALQAFQQMDEAVQNAINSLSTNRKVVTTYAGSRLFEDIDRQVEMQQGYYPPPPPAVGIDYGYNAYGDYVPTSVGNQRIQYGYNAVGDYVPTSVGNQRIHYGYNAYGDFVPMSIGD